MATTAKPIDFLVSGVRDTTGAVVASGKVRWYNPGTLVAAVAYSDAACSSAITAPLTLNAGGQGTIYCLEPVRVIVKDSTETVTYYDDIAPLQRHDSVYVTSTGINGGAETTLEAVLSTATTSLGSGFQYKESTGATARNYVDVFGELVVSVKDFGAVGDGTTDDTVACQAASDRVKARGGGWVYWPKGTYKITAPITGDTAGVNHRGAGRGVSIIKNAATTTNALSISIGAGSTDSKVVIQDLSITASTTSSGSAIVISNGNRPKLENVSVALHRTGFSLGSVTEARVIGCTVESTDDNASCVGISVGTRGRIEHCNIVCGTTNGTGVNLAGDARLIDSYIEKFGSGVGLNSAGAQARGCVASTQNTSYTLGANGTQVESCLATGAGVGFSVGAFAGCGVPFCRASTCTTDLSVNASATLFDDRGAAFTGTVTNSATSPAIMPLRCFFSSTTTASFTPTFTPDISGGKNINILICTAGAGAVTVTMANHATATLATGDIMVFIMVAQNGPVTVNAFGTQYQSADGTTAITTFGPTAANRAVMQMWRWDGTHWLMVLTSSEFAT